MRRACLLDISRRLLFFAHAALAIFHARCLFQITLLLPASCHPLIRLCRLPCVCRLLFLPRLASSPAHHFSAVEFLRFLPLLYICLSFYLFTRYMLFHD